MDWIQITGYTAGVLTTIAYIPQVYKVWKTKKADDVSFWMYLVMFQGVLMWLIYGFFISSMPIMVANSVTILLVSSVLVFKILKKGNKI